MLFLPPYIHQIEIRWRMIKIRITGRHFDTVDDLNSAITRLVESGEVPRVHIQIFQYPEFHIARLQPIS